MVTFESMVACRKALQSGVDLDVGLQNRPGCILPVRRWTAPVSESKSKRGGFEEVWDNASATADGRDERIIAGLSASKSLYDEEKFDEAVTKLTVTIESFVAIAPDATTMTPKEKTVLGACYALRGQCHEELGVPGCRQQAAQDYTAAIELDGDGEDEALDLELQLNTQMAQAFIKPSVLQDEVAVAPAVAIPTQLPTPQPALPKDSPPKRSLMGGNKPQKR
eukprot:COSAG02_NODE_25277_length_663_cov_1.102837_1_plen_221_part_11